LTRETCRHLAANYPASIIEPFDAYYIEFGFDPMYGILEHFSGMQIYVPGARTVFMDCILQDARHEFNGANYKELARKYGFSERALRRLL